MRDNGDIQIIIYLDNPKGQLMQVSLSDYHSYWRRIGWQIWREAKPLPGFPVTRREMAGQARFGL